MGHIRFGIISAWASLVCLTSTFDVLAQVIDAERLFEERYQIQPLKITQTVALRSRRTAHYSLACGVDFAGLLVLPDPKNPKHKLLAVVTRQRQLICAAFPEWRSISLSKLNIPDHWVSIPRRWSGRTLSQLKIFDFRLSSNNTSKKAIHILHQDSCHRLKGLWLQSSSQAFDDSTYLRVGMASVSGGRLQSKRCAKHQHLSKVKWDLHTEVVPFDDDNVNDADRHMDLHMASGDFRSLRRLGDGRISFAYRLTCQEQKLGIVIQAQAEIDSAPVVRLGVVTARRYNSQCDQPDRWQLAVTPMPIDPNTTIEVYRATDQVDHFTIIPVNSYDTHSYSRQTAIASYSACSKDWGVIYALGRDQKTYLGVLSEKTTDICNQPLKVSQTFQPPFGKSLHDGTIFPMSLANFHYL